MKLGIMQPYFFPYLGYFDLINCSDKWIVFDSVQHIRHGWVNRNRILHPKTGWQYITVPLRKYKRNTIIKDIEISGDIKWRQRILGQVQHYKKRAPYFSETYKFLEQCFAARERSISRLNVSILDKVCSYVGIPFDYEYFSEMQLELGPVEAPDEWALRISEAIEAEEYVNPSGGSALFNSSKFEALGIKLTIRNIPPLEYSCRGYKFIPWLSIIDVLMWNPPNKVKYYLDAHNI